MSNPALDRGDYTTKAAAEYLHITSGYMHVMRHHGTGPVGEKIDGRVYYTRESLDAWNAQRVSKKAARAEARAVSGASRRAAAGARGERKAGRKPSHR